MVSKRTGIGTTINMAKPAGKITMAIIGIILIVSTVGASIWMLLIDYTPIKLELTDKYIISGQLSEEYKISLNAVTKVELLEDKLVKYFREYLEDLGFEKEDIDSLGEPLVIRYVNFTAVRVMAVIGVVLLLLAGLLYRRRYRLETRGSGLRRAEDLPG